MEKFNFIILNDGTKISYSKLIKKNGKLAIILYFSSHKGEMRLLWPNMEMKKAEDLPKELEKEWIFLGKRIGRLAFLFALLED